MVRLAIGIQQSAHIRAVPEMTAGVAAQVQQRHWFHFTDLGHVHAEKLFLFLIVRNHVDGYIVSFFEFLDVAQLHGEDEFLVESGESALRYSTQLLRRLELP